MSQTPSKKIFEKVLFIGPDLNGKGGIASVLKSYRDNFVPFNYLSTNSRHGFLPGLAALIICALRMIPYRLSGRKILHVHYASGKSWLRKKWLAAWGRLLNYKIVMHCHSAEFDLFTERKGVDYIKKNLDKAHANIVLSQQWMKYFNEVIGCKNVHIVNNIVNKAPSIRKAQNDADTINFVFMGEICERKGIYDLLKAMSLLKKDGYNAMLIICGNGDTKMLKSLIADYGIEPMVRFEGWVDAKRRSEILLESHVMVLPSRAEGLPISLLEAMSFGLAIVSTPVGGIPQIVKDNENGLLTPFGHPELLAKAMATYIEKPELTSIHGEKGRDFVKNYYPENVEAQLIDVYNSVI